MIFERCPLTLPKQKTCARRLNPNDIIVYFYIKCNMAEDAEKSNETAVPAEDMGKKTENDTKSANPQDDDSESVEEQPLDIGEHYLVRRSDESWCKLTF